MNTLPIMDTVEAIESWLSEDRSRFISVTINTEYRDISEEVGPPVYEVTLFTDSRPKSETFIGTGSTLSEGYDEARRQLVKAGMKLT
jgi:hypothetical protein